ncbi:MAG TPA: methyltransferase domain-containing protein [Anaerolineales bacterium]|nr:methyltransferase domain-containing protein [Anaerolineales bacterium]HRQ92971.1 methyltransferase domain-containing protein [Anaerolineales bacterium]
MRFRKWVWQVINLARFRLTQLFSPSNALRLVVGADGTYYRGWLHTDINLLDITSEKDWAKFFRGSSLSAILAEHVWEHLSQEDSAKALRLCHRYLKPGGYLRIAVPDGFHPDPQYIAFVKPGGNGPGADDHKVLYTHSTLAEALANAGFIVNALEYYTDAGQFIYSDWQPEDGMVQRSSRFDGRNTDGVLRYTSLVIDGKKPAN